MGRKSKEDHLTWFRFHGDKFLHDERVQTLSPEHFKIWVNTLAFGGRRRNVSWNVSETLFKLRETEQSVSLAFHIFVEKGLLVNDKEMFYLADWDKLQYKSDSSTERVKRFRKRSKNVSETAPENRVNKERITNVIPPLFTKKEKEPTSVGSKRKPPDQKKDGYHRITHSTLPGEWKEWVTKNYGWDERMVGDVWVKFFEYFDRKRGASAQRSDWFATWRNWCDKENLPRKRVQEPKKHGEIPPQDLFKSVDGMPIL